MLGSPSNLAEVAAAHSAEHVIFAFTSEPDQQLLALAHHCERSGWRSRWCRDCSSR